MKWLKNYFKSNHLEVELEKCRESIVYFAEKYVKLKGESIKLYDIQKLHLESLEDNSGVSLLDGDRQTTKTTISLIFALWKFTCFEDQSIALFSEKSYYSKLVLSKFRDMFNSIPDDIKPKTRRCNVDELILDNGNSVGTYVNFSDLRGICIDVLIYDEVFQAMSNRNVGDFLNSYLPMLDNADNRYCILNGTGDSKDLEKNLKSRNINYNINKLYWFDLPYFDRSHMELTRSILGKEQFKLEYGLITKLYE